MYIIEQEQDHAELHSMHKLITGTRGRDHITPVLMDLHCLPVQARVDFKMLSIVHKAIYDVNAPVYMQDFIEFYQPSRHLRSSSDILRPIPHNFDAVLFRKSFIVDHFKYWNMLPNKLPSYRTWCDEARCLRDASHAFLRSIWLTVPGRSSLLNGLSSIAFLQCFVDVKSCFFGKTFPLFRIYLCSLRLFFPTKTSNSMRRKWVL